METSITPDLLSAIALILSLATTGVGFLARRKADSQHELSRYVLLGGILGALAGISWSAVFLVGASDPMALLVFLPVMLFAALVGGGFGAFLVVQDIWAYKRWKAYLSPPTDGEENHE